MIKGKLEITATAQAGDLLMLNRSAQISLMDFTICDKHLADKKIHMFIASQQWSELVINVHSNIDGRFIPLIAKKAKKVTLKFQDKIDENILNLVCTIYPEKSGKLRRYFMLGKSIEEVLQEV